MSIDEHCGTLIVETHKVLTRHSAGVVVVAMMFIMAGCRSTIPTCPPCKPGIKTIEVRVPVPVTCHVTLIEPPQTALLSVAPGNIRGILEALLADLTAWRRAYEAQRIAAEACGEQ